MMKTEKIREGKEEEEEDEEGEEDNEKEEAAEELSRTSSRMVFCTTVCVVRRISDKRFTCCARRHPPLFAAFPRNGSRVVPDAIFRWYFRRTVGIIVRISDERLAE